MKPVMQTKFGTGKGNCLSACVASILEMPIEEVPDFASASGIEWWDSLYAWLTEKGYGVILLDAEAPRIVIGNAFGIACVQLTECNERHAVVVQYKIKSQGCDVWTYEATIVHDPNPKHYTIKKTEEHIIILKP